MRRVSPLREIYTALHDRFGPQNWWPAESVLEVMVGAVLTQNTNWRNVSRAIDNLKQDHLLSLNTLHLIPVEVLAEKIRPSGYYNLKAARLKNLVRLLYEEGQNSGESDSEMLNGFFADDTASLRDKLLSVKGIGPETADSILLYGGGKPVFVIDAYTHRVLVRHGLIGEEADYGEMQEFFVDRLPEDAGLYNEYHALLVCLGKEFCKKRNPLCGQCPLREFEPIYVEDSV